MDCIFCGSRADSGEHLWPDRIGPDLDALWPEHQPEHAITVADPGREGAVRKIRTRYGPLYKLKIRCVCRTCNSEWMQRLDDAIYPQLLEMLNARPVVFTPAQVRTFARWVAMKTMVAEYQNPASAVIPTSVRTQFYSDPTYLPPRFFINLAYLGHLYWATAYHRQPGRLRTVPAVFDSPAPRAITTWGIGNLMIFTEYLGDLQPPLLLPRNDTVRLWPNGGTSVSWPPPERLTLERVSEYATRYDPSALSAAEDPIFFGPKPRTDGK